MITLKDIINQTEFDDVWKFMVKLNKIKNINLYNNYKNFYKKLLKITPSKNITNMFIYITAFKEDEDGDTYCISNFDEEDNTLFYEVTGEDNECSLYALDACSFESWLGFYIGEETFGRFTKPNIIAHCIWEMTFFGFEQKRDEEGRLII
ncbi:DUF6557 family protein [Clostridium lundense]|uniref:DUF6557 family protein n=1 Tax=Clostridium lundense TaxID=319475 RepID=UPI0004816F7F|nr:DUF6557 family protein [Clostridium lundense]